MIIREFLAQDYDSVYKLWEHCEFELGESDKREEIIKFINQNPKTSLVGELDGKIIGCIMGGYDGRRGLIHHLAVEKSYREKGYGRMLLEAVEKEFNIMGVVKLSFWVKTDNLKVVKFYEGCGYKLRNDIVTMSKSLK